MGLNPPEALQVICILRCIEHPLLKGLLVLDDEAEGDIDTGLIAEQVQTDEESVEDLAVVALLQPVADSVYHWTVHISMASNVSPVFS